MASYPPSRGRRARRPTAAALLGVVLLTTIAASGGNGGSATAGDGGAVTRGPSPRLELRACHGIEHARCGRLRVPVDVRDPSLGTTSVGFALFRRDDRARPARGTIVAVEGGPGYGTIASRFWYLRLFRPLMARHDLLLMDLRGTGRSDAARCPELQRWTKASHDVAWPVAEARCAARLGPMAERYGSAFAAQDLALLLDALAIDRIDLYGDSYGTFFAQTFAVRHPDRVRTLTLDAAYPIEGVDGWWRDTNAAARVALRRSCSRDATCTGDPLRAIRKVVRAVRHEPLVATVPDADGRPRHVRFTPETMGTILANSGYASTIDRELLAASRAFLRRRSDPAPLLRIAAEQGWYAGAGNVREYSQGLATATSCNDYPMLRDRRDPFVERRRAFRVAVGALRRDDPGAFDPLRIAEWATAADASYRSCIRWPAPEDRLRPFPAGGSYPDVPTLVLDGEFDSVTSPWGARRVARSFPDATYVEVPNAYHVTGLDGPGTCVTGIILRFVRRAAVGDTSCVRRTSPPIRVVEAFPVTADEVPGSLERRAAAIAAGTVGDVTARWDVMGGYEGVGLRGGTFRTWGYDALRWRLDGVRWVRDVAVDGRIATDTFSGRSEATVTLTGPSFPRSRLTVRWNALRPRARARVVGTVGGTAIDVRVPVP